MDLSYTLNLSLCISKQNPFKRNLQKNKKLFSATKRENVWFNFLEWKSGTGVLACEVLMYPGNELSEHRLYIHSTANKKRKK